MTNTQTNETSAASYSYRETVEVTLTGTVWSWGDDDVLLLQVALPSGFAEDHLARVLIPPCDTRRVKRLIPAEGEPQPGELWADQRGELYFACRDPRGGEAFLVSDERNDVPAQDRRWSVIHGGPAGPIRRVSPRPELGDGAP